MSDMGVILFGTRYKVREYHDDYTVSKYHICFYRNTMYLLDDKLDVTHKFVTPRVEVIRLDDGPRTWRGVDKGRWFIIVSDDGNGQENFIGYKKLMCANRGAALSIRDTAERIAPPRPLPSEGPLWTKEDRKRSERILNAARETRLRIEEEIYATNAK